MRWDGSKVTNKEVRDYLPSLLQLKTVKPCLLLLDDAWNIKQVFTTLLSPPFRCVLPSMISYPARGCAQVRSTVDIARKGGKVRMLITTRDERILKLLKVSVQVIISNPIGSDGFAKHVIFTACGHFMHVPFIYLLHLSAAGGGGIAIACSA